MVNVKTRQLTLGGQFDAYKRGQLERNIHTILFSLKNLVDFRNRIQLNAISSTSIVSSSVCSFLFKLLYHQIYVFLFDYQNIFI